MNETALNRAIKCLSFADVFVNSANCMLAEEFDPKFDPRVNDLCFQTKNIVTHSEIIVADSDEFESSHHVFRVCSELGVRIAERGQLEDTIENPDVLCQVEAVMYADYDISDLDIINDQEALDEFALNNVSYHVWPYWREYVTSQLTRMNMPKLVLPMFLRPSNQSDEAPK